MKIKIGESWGSRIDRDLARVEPAARHWPATAPTLMVDANGGYTVGQARRVGAALDELGVVWFEEPVSSDDTGGLAAAARRRCAATSPPASTPPTSTTPRAAARRGLPAARRHPLRRLHRLAARRRPRRRAQPAGLRALRAVPARPGRRRRARTCATSNGSPTTPGWNRCSSTALPAVHDGALHPDTTRPDTA